MTPSTSTCLHKGQGSLILSAPVFLRAGECSILSSTLGESTMTGPWIGHFHDTEPDLPLYRSGTVDLGMPRMLAVGSQSVGKSSLIENISGVRLRLSGPRFISSARVDNPPS